MYKILYLPLGEEVLISTNYRAPYIPAGVKSWESPINLKVPGLKALYAQYKTAIFTEKETAREWIQELINRGSCKDLGLLPEYFEIIDINRD